MAKFKQEYKVLSTRNYEMFKLLLGNREVSESRKKRVRESIEAIGLLPIPIIINEKNEVIDGQARLDVFKGMGFPIYYQRVEGIGLKECIEMNKNSTAWNLQDFVSSYVAQGNKDYKILDQFTKKYHPKVSFDTVTYALSGSTQAKHEVKTGKFKVDHECLNIADDQLNFIISCLDQTDLKGRRVAIEIALGWCYLNDRIDNGRLRKMFRSRLYRMPAYANTSGWIEGIEEAYNYKLNKNKQVSIRALWEIDYKEKQAGKKREEKQNDQA